MSRNAMAHKNKLIRLQTNLSNTFCYVFKVVNANCAINALHHIMDTTTPDWTLEHVLILEDTEIYAISQGCCKSSWAVARSFGSRRKHLVIRSVAPAMSSGFNVHPVSWIHISNGLRLKCSNFLSRPDHKMLITKTSVNRTATHSPAENNLSYESNAEENLPRKFPHKKWSSEKAIRRLPTHHVQRIPLV